MLGTWVSGVVLVGGTLMFGCCRAWGCLVQPSSCEGGGNGSVGGGGGRCTLLGPEGAGWSGVLSEGSGRAAGRGVPLSGAGRRARGVAAGPFVG
jgi:hypothetical protein